MASTPVTTDTSSDSFFVFDPGNLAEDVDTISFHNDFIGVPWDEFADGDISGLPDPWVQAVDAWVDLAEETGKEVFLSLALVGGSEGRNTLASRATTSGGTLATEDGWAASCFNFHTDADGERWRQAYLAYVRYMVGRFQPVFLNHAIEVNLFSLGCDPVDPDAFDSIMEVADAAYDAAKELRPGIVAFPSFQIDTMRDNQGEGWCSAGSEGACFAIAFERVQAMKRDRFAVSTYPFISELVGGTFRETWFEEIAQATGERLVVAETGFASDDLLLNTGSESVPACAVYHEADEPAQEAYLTVLLTEAERLGMDLVTWWSGRDIFPSRFVTECPCETETDYCAVLSYFRQVATPPTPENQAMAELAFRVFESMGVRRWDGTPKAALTTWRAWLARPRDGL